MFDVLLLGVPLGINMSMILVILKCQKKSPNMAPKKRSVTVPELISPCVYSVNVALNYIKYEKRWSYGSLLNHFLYLGGKYINTHTEYRYFSKSTENLGCTMYT